jgi:hypothetical protein
VGGKLLVVLAFAIPTMSGCGRSCHSSREGSTPRAALDAYYSGCSWRPTEVKGPSDADIGGSFDADIGRAEFAVSRKDRVRFIIVERATADQVWRVVSDGSGP